LLGLGGAIAVGVLLVGIAALEWRALREDAAALPGVATHWHDPNTQFDAWLGWRPIPSRRVDLDWGAVETNARGFRSAPLRPDAQAVVVLGDSVAWGLGVDAQDTFAGRLDAAFAARGWQVSNLAVSGYGLGQTYLWLREQRVALPELRHAILALCADNDVDDTSSNSRYGRRKPLFRIREGTLTVEGVPIARNSLRHWYTDSRFVRGVLGRAPRLESMLLARMGDRRLDAAETNEVIRKLIVAIRDEVQARGGTLHLVLLPARRDFPTLSADYELLRQAALATGDPPTEVGELMRALELPLDALFLDASHLTPRGHGIVAFALRARLERYEERTRPRSQAATTPSS
jgi:lysophospholipase L1-like esterase